MYYDPFRYLFVFAGVIIAILDLYAVATVWASSKPKQNKLLWTVAIVLFPLAGLLSFFALGRDRTDMALN